MNWYNENIHYILYHQQEHKLPILSPTDGQNPQNKDKSNQSMHTNTKSNITSPKVTLDIDRTNILDTMLCSHVYN